MSLEANRLRVYPLRTVPKDLGVALVVLAALGLGLLLRTTVEGRTQTFDAPEGLLGMSYPATWRAVEAPTGLLLRVEDPQTLSTYKSTVEVESRELDPSAPPTMQQLVDRRVLQRSDEPGYHFLSSSETTVAGVKSTLLEYAYVAQPIDTPRRASLPVVVRSRTYVVVAPDRVYYITLAAPQEAYEEAGGSFDGMIKSVRLK